MANRYRRGRGSLYKNSSYSKLLARVRELEHALANERTKVAMLKAMVQPQPTKPKR